jgi:hypothetical protein
VPSTLGRFSLAAPGWWGRPPDFVRFLETVRKGGDPSLRRATAEAMMTAQIGGLAVETHGPGWGFGFGGAVLLHLTCS